jgi:hypothetical protein
LSEHHLFLGKLIVRNIAIAAAAAAMMLAFTDRSAAHDLRNPLRIDVPDQPRLRNTTQPVLYKCSGAEDCQKQAADFCKTFNYPNGRILFRNLPEVPPPFPIYSVICFD